ncbi:MAG: hypothetical protein QM765_07935 [Myxococcales bacterium]
MSRRLGFLAASLALRAAPGDSAALQLCLELGKETGLTAKLEALLEELAPLAVGAATRAALFRALFRLQLEAGSDAGAQASLRAVLEACPSDREASEALEAVYGRLGRSREQAELLRRRLGQVRGASDKVALLERIAGLYEGAQDDGAAVDALREGHALEPRPALLARLEPMLGRLKRFDEQAEVLRELITRSPAEATRELLGRRAAALAAAGQDEKAVGVWAQVLSRWPGDGDAVAGLERALREASADAARQEAGRLLEAAHRARGDSRRLVEMLELRLDQAPVAERARLLCEVAGLREDLGDATLAFSARRRLFAEAPGDAETRAALERLAVGAGMGEELVAAYEDVLEKGVGAELALLLWRRVAQIRSERPGEREAAAAAWEQVLARAPRDAAALFALGALYGESGDAARLAGLRARQAELEATPGAKAARLHEAAEIARRKDDGVALRCYQRILELVPDDLRALDSIRELVAAGGPRGALAPVLEREIAQAAARRDLKTGLERRLELARIRLDYLNDAPGAFSLWEEALKLSPGYRPALDELEQLALSEDPERCAAAERLEPALLAAGDWPRLVKVLEAHAAAAPAPQRPALLARAADHCVEQLADAGHAFVLVARALREVPTDEALLARARELASKADMRQELCALLEDLSEAAEGGAARARLLCSLAAEQERAGDDEGALQSWQRALDQHPSNGDAETGLEALLARLGKWSEPLQRLQAQVAKAMDAAPEALAALWTRIAEARRKLGDEDGAVEAQRQALAAEPSPARLEALAVLFAELGRHRDRAAALEELAERVAEPEQRRQHLIARADALRLAGDYEAAVEACQVAFALGGAGEALISALEKLVEAKPGLERASVLLAAVRGEERA